MSSSYPACIGYSQHGWARTSKPPASCQCSPSTVLGTFGRAGHTDSLSACFWKGKHQSKMLIQLEIPLGQYIRGLGQSWLIGLACCNSELITQRWRKTPTMLGVILHSSMWPVPSFLLGSTCKLRDAKELLYFQPKGNEPMEQRESGERDLVSDESGVCALC